MSSESFILGDKLLSGGFADSSDHARFGRYIGVHITFMSVWLLRSFRYLTFGDFERWLTEYQNIYNISVGILISGIKENIQTRTWSAVNCRGM